METPISPKVIVSVIVGIVLTAIASNVSAITPDMFNFLGPWKLFVFGSLITALMGLAAWWKTDPLRVTPESSKTDTAAISASTGGFIPTPAGGVKVQLSPGEIIAPAASFAPTQAKIDALAAPEPVAVEPVFTPPAAQTIA
jgi:hypothetical protein